MSANFKKIMDLVNQDSFVSRRARECATDQMIMDGCEEIGSSDINCTIVDYMHGCETLKDVILRLRDWCNEVA
jgi:hypothetical protein